jgi:hypothetical protein
MKKGNMSILLIFFFENNKLCKLSLVIHNIEFLSLVHLVPIRLPLRLTGNANLDEFIEKTEIADAGKLWNFDAGNVTVVELPNPDHEVAHTQFTRQFLSAFSNLAIQDDVDNIAGTST